MPLSGLTEFCLKEYTDHCAVQSALTNNRRAKANTLCNAGCSSNLNSKAIATVQSEQVKSKEV
jgi:hypothetical protein